jgi:7-carboxy-7-deazaguanine synthase
VSYSVKEIFYTLQGEGANAGRVAVFCRFSGCNLWSGREEDRQRSVCRFCDTDFVGTDGAGGGKFDSARELALAIESFWPSTDADRRFVVFTGGEPLLQLDAPLLNALKSRGFFVAVETNGTIPPPAGIDWICVSPKSDSVIQITCGQELKFVYPQADVDPSTFSSYDFSHFFLQPMDGPLRAENTEKVIEYCKAHPKWAMSTQVHKVVGIR